MSHSKFERKLKKDGTSNPKYIDLLDEDKAIAGQKFVCVSFISPENILKKKELFLFERFIKTWEMNKSMEKFTLFLNFLSYKYKLTIDDLMKDFEEFVKEERNTITETTLYDDYKTFIDKNEDELEKEFSKAHEFQTHTRGLKIRGSYPSIEEAELRCKLLREIDPHHDVYVGPVGMWMPWEPEAYKTGRVEYMEEELNKLMSEKNKNEQNAKDAFEQRIKETRKKAIEENIANAEKSGNTLTQTIDEEGNLIGVGVANTQEKSLSFGKDDNSVVSSKDVRAELFEGENIVIPNKNNKKNN